MIVDGRAVAKRIYDEVAAEVATLSRVPVMAAITCAPNFETKRYLELKKRKAAEVGISLRVVELPETATTAEAISCVNAVLPDVDGVVVQLPFPAHVDREALLAVIPASKDPDGFSYGTVRGACVPPVPRAIAEIARVYGIRFEHKHVVVMGEGRLVGAPTALFLKEQGAEVVTVTEATKDAFGAIANADILVTGIGKPQYITVDMVKQGVIIFDAGTSEDGGEIAGDVHPAVADVASLFTPVPGGIGPITIAALLRNVVDLVRQETTTL